MIQIKYTCSECGSELEQVNDKFVCPNCKREKTFRKQIETVDMNDTTKNMEPIYG